jgi:helicase MOV-10
VKHIVAGTARPGPYLVFGPPGTGKSVTLVEAMKQVLKQFPEARLLVSAPSNSAADLLAERLMPHVDKRHLLRFNAPSRPVLSIPDSIRVSANTIYPHVIECFSPVLLQFDGWSGHYSAQERRSHAVPRDCQYLSVIWKVCTICVCVFGAMIWLSRIASANISSGHFTHVFIDECGQAQETEAIIAQAGVLDNHLVSPKGGHLILAGDPRQLGPVLRSPVAKAYGLGKCFLRDLNRSILFLLFHFRDFDS